ncbi:MAG: biopolymer transporter ExbD [Nitrospiraceae bacterium]|nr:biopolymer transporter ExbD [Nitrospiraceae bacterium]
MSARHKPGTALSEINVTPLVDVMLVLLVIFMVTAPLLQQGVDVKLPQAHGKPLATEERISIEVSRNGGINMNNAIVSMDQMTARLKALAPTNPNVFLKADRDVPYGIVAKIMGDIKYAGIQKLGIVTEPLPQK